MANILEDRDQRVLDAAIAEAQANGYQWITREAVATRAGVSVGTVNNVHGTMVELKRAVLRAAVERRIVDIVAQGLADRHPIVMEAPQDLREEAARTLISG